MKESIQKTKQLARTIQESGKNQRVGFVDNRSYCSNAMSLFHGIVQLKRLTDENMVDEAAVISGGETRSTLAIAKIGEDDYALYAQRTTPKIRDSKDEYDNLSKVEWIHGSWPGLHAEMFAVSNEANISKIAASQGICMRCRAALTHYGIDALNPGDQYTANWIAPTADDRDENSPFPAIADDPSGNGESGWRYGMKSGDRFLIKQEKWKPIHPKW